jgi:predicted O-methyltransferase YrrM
MCALWLRWLGLAAVLADARVVRSQKTALNPGGLLGVRAPAPVGPMRALLNPRLSRGRVVLQDDPKMQAVAEAPLPQLVQPADCPSCEQEFLARSKEFEAEELVRLREEAATNLDGFLANVWDYANLLNESQRAQLALGPDVSLRKFILESSTPPTPFMDTVFQATLQRVQYEAACYLCSPEQATLLRAIAAFVQPRHALDIGSFTGYSSSAVLEALPDSAELTCLESEKDYARLAVSQLIGRNVNFMVGDAMHSLKSFEKQGKQFDFIALDADKPGYVEYYEMALKLLRPGGVLVLFGLILYPTVEDQVAMEKMQKILEEDTRVNTALLPVGCGLQLTIKKDAALSSNPLSPAALEDRSQYGREAELAALDRAIAQAEAVPKAPEDRNWGPGTEIPTSAALVAQAASYRQAAELAANGGLAPAQSEGGPTMQFGFKGSERLLARKAWEAADAYRPGKSNWFNNQQQDLLSLHETLKPLIDNPSTPTVKEQEDEALLGALLKQLTLGDLAVTMASKEPEVLKSLREWLMKPESGLTVPQAVEGLPEEQGRVLGAVAMAMDARNILDLGTFTGYSSIAMALATADDARVVCCEPDPRYASHARDWWRKAGVEQKMEMHEVPAEVLLQRLLDEGRAGTFDMVFVDVGERDRYSAIHEMSMELLRVGGTVIYYSTLWPADDTLRHSYFPALRDFAGSLSSDPRVVTSLIPLSYGITVAVKVLSADGPQLAAARAAGPSAVADVLRQRRSVVAGELGHMPVHA